MMSRFGLLHLARVQSTMLFVLAALALLLGCKHVAILLPLSSITLLILDL